MRTSLCWLLAVSLALPSQRAQACPIIETPPFGAQIAQARAIVVARVEGHSTMSLELDFGDVQVQHLRVVRTLKGAVPQRFRVNTGNLMAEPFDFEPIEDRTARIYFVGEQEETDEGAEPMLSVEELRLENPDDLAVFIDRIDELQRLRARGASAAEELEWLVRCAMRRATRGHAVQALLSQGRVFPTPDAPPVAPELTYAQRRAILDGFRQEPSTDGTLVAVLALGRGVAHPAFDRAAVGAVETLLWAPLGELRAEAPQALLLLMERLGVENAAARWAAANEELGEPELEDGLEQFPGPHQRLRALWNALRAEGALVPAPSVPPAGSAVDRTWLSVD